MSGFGDPYRRKAKELQRGTGLAIGWGMENATLNLTKWTASYAGRAGHKFRRAAVGSFVAISISYPAETAKYVTEVYTVGPDGMESFLGYETAVCVHPGAMMHAINAARPVWAVQADHLAVSL